MKNANVSLLRLLISIALLLALWAPSAQAETIDCTAISSLPYAITVQGIYCFTGNLSTSMASGNAITINTNNVTLDLNGYKLGGLGAGDSTQTYGIYAVQRKNITIKNGIIRGFYSGIRLADTTPWTSSSGNVVKNILADKNTHIGIWVEGLGNTMSHNTVVDTGGSTATNGAIGIRIYGSGAKVVNNTISTTTAQSSDPAYGMSLSFADYSLAQNNTVTDTIEDTGNSVAIYITGSTGVFVRNNNLANALNGLVFSASSGKYFNNLTFDITTPFTGGTPIGSNNN